MDELAKNIKMIRFKQNIISISLIVFLIIVISMLIVTAVYDCQAAKEQIRNTIPSALQEAVNVNARKKTVGIPFYAYVQQSGKTETHEERIFQTMDTTFTYQCKIVDPETHIQRSEQNFLLVQEALHSCDIQPILDSLLHEKNIYANIAIGITASHYKKLNEWSKDTTMMNIRLRASYLKQGLFEDINYYAYTDYSYATLWKLMPHTSTLALAVILLLVGILFVSYKIREKRRHSKEIKSRPSLMDAKICEERKKILLNGEEIKFTPQMVKILSLFMEGEGRVKKTELQKALWPNATAPINNMTSAIRVLKHKLKEENFTDIIISDSENNEFYRLVPSSTEHSPHTRRVPQV